MPQFGQRSLAVLDTLDHRLKLVLNEAIKRVPTTADFSLIEGYRDEETQNRYYDEGVSTLRWPDSYHNNLPSLAVDLIPYPTGFDDIDRFNHVATYIFAAAQEFNVTLEWGGHWRTFKDYPHWQIRR